MDLGGARQQRLVGQQLGEDAAHGPAERGSRRGQEVPLLWPPPGPLLPSPYHMSMLVVCVVIPSSSSGARYLRGGRRRLEGTARGLACVAPSRHEAQHSPESDDFGGHGLGRHPVGAGQAEIGCNKSRGEAGGAAPRPGLRQAAEGARLAAAGVSPIFTQPLSVMSRLDTFRSLRGSREQALGTVLRAGLGPARGWRAAQPSLGDANLRVLQLPCPARSLRLAPSPSQSGSPRCRLLSGRGGPRTRRPPARPAAPTCG